MEGGGKGGVEDADRITMNIWLLGDIPRTILAYSEHKDAWNYPRTQPLICLYGLLPGKVEGNIVSGSWDPWHCPGTPRTKYVRELIKSTLRGVVGTPPTGYF